MPRLWRVFDHIPFRGLFGGNEVSYALVLMSFFNTNTSCKVCCWSKNSKNHGNQWKKFAPKQDSEKKKKKRVSYCGGFLGFVFPLHPPSTGGIFKLKSPTAPKESPERSREAPYEVGESGDFCDPTYPSILWLWIIKPKKTSKYLIKSNGSGFRSNILPIAPKCIHSNHFLQLWKKNACHPKNLPPAPTTKNAKNGSDGFPSRIQPVVFVQPGTKKQKQKTTIYIINYKLYIICYILNIIYIHIIYYIKYYILYIICYI